MGALTIPDAIVLTARFKARDLAASAGLVNSAVHNTGRLGIARWSVPATAPRKSVKSGDLPKELLTGHLPPEMDTATLELGEGGLGSLYHPFGESCWAFKLSLEPEGVPERVPAVLAAQRSVAHALINSGSVLQLSVSMLAAGANCLPEVPIALARTYLVGCTRAQVAEAYMTPEDFWNSGWESIEWIDEQAILGRAMGVSDTASYLREVIPQQWALARVAKPGLCRYGMPTLTPEENEIYFSGPPALNLVGYDEAEASPELSCSLQPPQHVQGWEILNLYSFLQSGSLPDGRPVKGIRVVFLYESMARSERRPLLDIGVRVLYYDAHGHLQEMCD